MFEALGDKLYDVFRRLRGNAVLTESNVSDAMKEILDALLEADVNISVAKAFTNRVSQRVLGENVLKSVTPAQQVVKLVHDELVSLLGGDAAPLTLESNPTVIMLVGLHGSGKTTTSGKLANYLRLNEKKSPLLVSRRSSSME